MLSWLLRTVVCERDPLDDPATRVKLADYNCYKWKICTPGGGPVCGFDERALFLAEFDDKCTLHKVNCERRGLFHLVEDVACEGQKKFEATYKFGFP